MLYCLKFYEKRVISEWNEQSQTHIQLKAELLDHGRLRKLLVVFKETTSSHFPTTNVNTTIKHTL